MSLPRAPTARKLGVSATAGPLALPDDGLVCGRFSVRGSLGERSETARFFRLQEVDLDRIVALHRLVLSEAIPGTVRADNRDFFASTLDGLGLILGLKAEDDALVAYAVLSLKPAAVAEYGASIALPESELGRVACLDGISVHPDWRGNGIHEMLARWRIEAAHSLGRRHIFATVAPVNHISWGTLVRLDMWVRAIGQFYGGMLRYVLYRDVAGPSTQPAPDASIEVPVDALERQRELLTEGMVGWRKRTVGGRPLLAFGRVNGP
jgi:GNAT superfamily N-acetyltransferase